MDFESKVLELVKQIPLGKVTTYGIIAEKSGLRSSARMVGWVLNKQINNLDLPCHRVVNRFGALSGKLYFPTPDYMKEMLLSEGITFDENDCVLIKKYLWDFTT